MQTFLENWARHCAQEFERLRLFQFPVIWGTLAVRLVADRESEMRASSNWHVRHEKIIVMDM
jgi:hypothetical protein